MKIIFLFLLVSFCEAAFAQSSARFNITRAVITGGGATASTSSRFQLSSTLAQPLAAVPSSTRLAIQGGFWIWPAPILFAPTKAGTNFLVSIQSEPGQTYTVQYFNSPGSSWQNLTTVAGNGNVITVTNAALGVPQRFYRLIEQ